MTIRFFREKDRDNIHELLEGLQRPVHLLLFISDIHDEYGDIAGELLRELVAIHRHLSLEICEIETHATQAEALGVYNLPALVILGGSERTDYNIRFYGLPSGYTFPALLEAVLMVGGVPPSPLRPATQDFLDQLSSPLYLQVFVIASDSACPATAALACKLALASPYVAATTVEILAFPQLAWRYKVRHTPTIVINGRVVIEGEASELYLLDFLRAATG
ncbi:MAG: glutaredoxin [Chloroflexales bacterium]|nr:glutaredoxin [Chloroflexales bacterium]